jgi:hypothetical protein
MVEACGLGVEGKAAGHIATLLVIYCDKDNLRKKKKLKKIKKLRIRKI